MNADNNDRSGAVLDATARKRSSIRALLAAFGALVLSACAAVLLVAGGSFSSNIAAVAVLGFPFEGIDRYTVLLPVGADPGVMALEPGGRHLFVGEDATRALAVVDTSTLEVTDRILLMDETRESLLDNRWGAPLRLAFSPDGSRLFVTVRIKPLVGYTEGLVLVDPASGDVLSRLDTQGTPGVLAVTPDGRKVYVAHTEGNVAVVDADSFSVTSVVPVDREALGIAISADGDWLVVANTGDLEGDPSFGIPPTPGNTVTVIDTSNDSVASTLTVGEGPAAILMQGDKAYVVNQFSGTVSVIDMASLQVTGELDVGATPLGAASVEETRRLYVSSFDGRQITVIDTDSDSVVTRMAVAGQPTALAATEEGSRLFALVPAAEEVLAYDLTSGAQPQPITVGDSPIALAIQDDARQGFALAMLSNDLTVFDTDALKVKAVVALELQPFTITVDQGRQLAYVPNTVHNTLSVLDLATDTVTQTVRVGSRPLSVALDGAGQFGYTLNLGDRSISKIDLGTRKAVATFAGFGGLSDAGALAASADGARVYVVGSDPDTFDLVVAALDSATGSRVGAWTLSAFHRVAGEKALVWDSVMRNLYTLGVYTEDGISFGGLIVSRLDTQTGILEDLFIISDADGVSLAVTADERVLVSDAVTRQVYSVNANDLADFAVLATGASDFVALTPLDDRLFVSDAGPDYPFSQAGAVVGVTLPGGQLAFSASFDSRVSGMGVSPDGNRVYGALTERDSVAVLDAQSGAVLNTVVLPAVQRFE